MLKVAVIGYGYWGPNLARNFHRSEKTELAAVVDAAEARRQLAEVTYPGVRTTANLEDVLGDTSVDAVAIATPVDTHFDLGGQALRAGKHVLLEKPLTASVEEAEELIRLAEEQKRTLMVDHTFLYCGPVRKLRELVDVEELGEIQYLDSVRVNLGLFRHDINVVWDLAPHDFSIMDYVLQASPTSVVACGATHFDYSPKPLENTAYVHVGFENHLLAHFHVNWLTPVKIRRMLICGSRKMVIYDHLDADNQIKVFDKGVDLVAKEDIHRVLVQYRMGDMYAPKIDQTEPLLTMCEHFADCIKTGTRPISDGQAGLKVVKLLDACDRSLAKDGVKVAV